MQDPFVFHPLQISVCVLHAEREPGREERVHRGEHVTSRELVPRAPVLAGAQGVAQVGRVFGSPGGLPACRRGCRAAAEAGATR